MNYSKSIITKYATAALLLGVVFLSCKPVVGFDQDNLLLRFDWSDNIFFQGDSGNVTISVKSICPYELKFNWIGVHFSWMDENNYYGLDFSGNPLIVDNGSLTSLGAIEFIIPLDVPIGLNQYYVMIYYKENESDNAASKAWTSQTFKMQIHNHHERTYNVSRSFIWDSIKAADYEDAAAKALRVRAAEEYNFSIMLADQGLWEGAVACLLNSSRILAEASKIEMEHWRYQAFELINTIAYNTNQPAYESLEAESLLSQARSLTLEAQGNFSTQTLDGYKHAFFMASEAKSNVELAFTEEGIYHVKKQEATDKINNATFCLIQTSIKSSISKELLREAWKLLSRSQNALLMRTKEGCESANLYAEQALSKISQAVEVDPVHHVQMQQQQYLIVAGSFAIGASGLYLFLFVKPKKGGFNTLFSSLSAHLSSYLFRDAKTEPLDDLSIKLIKDRIQSADDFQDDDDSIAKLIRQASNLSGDESS